jgi:hypothetical protein
MEICMRNIYMFMFSFSRASFHILLGEVIMSMPLARFAAGQIYIHTLPSVILAPPEVYFSISYVKYN